MEIIYSGLRSIEGGSEKKLFSGDLIIRLDEQTDREVKSREEKKEEVEKKRRRCTFSAIISAHLSRVFLLRLSPRHKPRSLSRVRSLDS